MFRASFKEVFKGGLKHINENFVVVVVVCQSSQLPEQKEGLFLIPLSPQTLDSPPRNHNPPLLMNTIVPSHVQTSGASSSKLFPLHPSNTRQDL